MAVGSDAAHVRGARAGVEGVCRAEETIGEGLSGAGRRETTGDAAPHTALYWDRLREERKAALAHRLALLLGGAHDLTTYVSPNGYALKIFTRRERDGHTRRKDGATDGLPEAGASL